MIAADVLEPAPCVLTTSTRLDEAIGKMAQADLREVPVVEPETRLLVGLLELDVARQRRQELALAWARDREGAPGS